jgi:glycosyltransferase involved in cell wall biosynthesis
MVKLARAEPPNLRSDRSVPAIVNVGRLVPQKNQLLLVDAFKLVTDKRAAQLWIVGEGPRRADLEKRIDELGLSQSVRLFGHVSNPLPILRDADVFALSSSHEGFGNVLVEAMWTGTPVVATDCPYGPAEILENGKWGQLVPAGNAEALAEAILDILENGGIDARTRAEDFTADNAVRQYLELIEAPVTG